MELFLAIFLKPFIALVFLTIALLIAGLIHKHMPDSKLKRMPFQPGLGQA
jgi:hypothetical protein